MKQKLVCIWRAFRFPLIITFGTLPVPLLLTACCAPLFPGQLWLWTGGYILLDVLGTRIRGRWRLLYGAAVIVAAGFVGWGLYGAAVMALADLSGWKVIVAGSSLAMLLIPAQYCFLLICGLRLGTEERNVYMSPLWYQFGVAIHILAQVFRFASEASERSLPDWVSPLLLISFFLFALLGMVSMNQSNLHRATGERQQASVGMRRKNLMMTLIFFGAAALLSAVPVLAELILLIFRWVVNGLLWVIYVLTSWELVKADVQSGKMPVVPPAFSGEAFENLFYRILTTGVVLATAFFLIGLVLYVLARKIPTWLRAMMGVLNRRDTDSGADFEDEITDTREDSGRHSHTEKRLSAAEERKLPPDQRIRYRYKRLMQKHPEWDSGSTARENLPQAASHLYERVRYSSHPITEEDAQQFITETKKIDPNKKARLSR